METFTETEPCLALIPLPCLQEKLTKAEILYIPRLFCCWEEPWNKVRLKTLFSHCAECPLCVAVCSEVCSPLEEGSQGQEKRESDGGKQTRGTSWYMGDQERDRRPCLHRRV